MAHYGKEFADWMLLSPQQRWVASFRLWDTFFAIGGCLDDDVSENYTGDHAAALATDAAHRRARVYRLQRLGV